MRRIGLARGPLFLLHSNGPGHPESLSRLQAIDRMLEGFPFRDQLRTLPQRDATHEELSWVHDERYLRTVAHTRGVPRTTLDPDTSTNAHSFESAVRAVGGAIVRVFILPLGAVH